MARVCRLLAWAALTFVDTANCCWPLLKLQDEQKSNTSWAHINIGQRKRHLLGKISTRIQMPGLLRNHWNVKPRLTPFHQMFLVWNDKPSLFLLSLNSASFSLFLFLLLCHVPYRPLHSRSGLRCRRWRRAAVSHSNAPETRTIVRKSTSDDVSEMSGKCSVSPAASENKANVC